MIHKQWNDPEVQKFMRSVGGISRSNTELVKKPYVSKRRQGEDLTVNGYIRKYGGIRSNIDDKVYNSKKEYMAHIKESGHVIKDW